MVTRNKTTQIATKTSPSEIVSQVQTHVWSVTLKALARRAADVDIHGRWPEENIRQLHAAGALGWAIPRKFGGAPLSPAALHRRYQQIASVCLATALILTQRDAAIEFLTYVSGHRLGERLLSQLAANRTFITIGLAQLTTSGQHDLPLVCATRQPDGWLVSGIIPWATGAHHADWIVAGARVGDGEQLLFLLLMRRKGVRVLPAARLSVLNATDTAAIELKSVHISDNEVIAGPSNNVLTLRQRQKRFSLNTCILPLGVAGGALQMARELAKPRSVTCRKAVAQLARRHRHLAAAVYAAGTGSRSAVVNSTGLAIESDSATTSAGDKTMLRATANILCSQSVLAALELAKGRGLSCQHAAQRRARESQFFFVWSSSGSVIEKTLTLLAAPPVA